MSLNVPFRYIQKDLSAIDKGQERLYLRMAEKSVDPGKQFRQIVSQVGLMKTQLTC